MKRKRLLLFSVLTATLFSCYRCFSQNIPVGSSLIDEYRRNWQLIGLADSTISLLVRPAQAAGANDIAWLRNSLVLDTIQFPTEPRGGGRKVKFAILPFNWQQQFNSSRPYGWNDGAMIPARGYQTMVAGGVYAQYGPLSIRLQPELVLAGNRSYKGYPVGNNDTLWSAYYGYYLNTTDIPEQFGRGGYQKLSWGQSSIRLTFDPVSIGLSNENLWWGPGVRNSLLMSNNAPGFKHITLNTMRPVKTPIGSVEAQMLVGRLENSGYLPPETDRVLNGSNLYSPKRDEWRYLSALTFSYQPKWIPGLFVGLSRIFQVYHSDLGNGLGDYIPVFSPFQKVKTKDEDAKGRDQLASVFARWVFEKNRSEIYFEYGRNDHSWNVRDFLLEPEHSRAYLLGMKKIFPLNRHAGQYLLVNLEATQLQQTASRIVREAGAWYQHGVVRQGYTHKGQVMGAGIGPGSNHQSFDLSWMKGLKKIGVQLERYVHNNDFYYAAYSNYDSHWVDLTAGVYVQWNYRNMLLNAKLTGINSWNYQWTRSDDKTNVQALLGVKYIF